MGLAAREALVCASEASSWATLPDRSGYLGVALRAEFSAAVACASVVSSSVTRPVRFG